MPPLISEELDEVSTTDRETTDDQTLNTPDQISVSDLGGGVGNAEDVGDVVVVQVHTATTATLTSEQPASEMPNPDDSALGEQLQRSAEESLSDAEAATDSATQADPNGDVTMDDADADGEAEEDEDAEGETDDDAAAEEAAGDEEEEDGEEHADSSDESEGGDEASTSSESESESSEADTKAEDLKPECLFCKSTKEPNNADEPDLTCTECGSLAHLHCAKEKSSVKIDASSWRCPDCLEKRGQSDSPKEQSIRSKNSAPRLVRDLLPVTRGVQKPNSHSIFAQPLISEGEDGGRALRKRKSPTQEPPPMSEKRRRKATIRALATPTDVTVADNKFESNRAVAHSTRRAFQKPTLPVARILQHRPFAKPPPHKFILAFRLDQSKIEAILEKPPRPGKRRAARATEKKRLQKIPPPIFQPPVPKFPALPTHHLIFPSAFTDREAELNAKPYGGILTEAEADTSRSLPQLKDREIFEIARKEAEEERRKTSAAAEAEINGDSATIKPKTTISGPPSKIKCIQFGKFVIDTFYAAPYPEEYSHESRLFICEYCLKYLPSEFVAYRHKLKCPAKHPPGDEIYREGSISVWEVDGRKKTEYCQCLCLMAKMFLGSKTLYYDVEPFLFYILTEYDEFGYHFVGYFSKEKRPASQNNVSCILVMPIHQRKGYATFLIDFSYLLTRIEGKDGSPEKPLSDMGLTAYRSYWDLTISQHLLDLGMKPFSTKTLMLRTGMTADDVIHSLERLYAFIRDPVTKTYAVRYDKKLYERIVAEFSAKNHRTLRPEKLVWTPYIMGRSDQATLDGQPIHAIAPRDDESETEEVPAEVNALSEGVDMKKEPEDLVDSDPISPRSKSKALPSHQSVEEEATTVQDPALINEHGHVAPGPPSTEVMKIATSLEATQSDIKLNGLTNGDRPTTEPMTGNGKEPATEGPPTEEVLTGYALAYRTLNIPPARFQIEPPIPPAMLRQRSVKKRNQATAFGTPKANGLNDLPSIPVAVRSSPRNASSSVNGSASGSGGIMSNGNRSRLASPDKGPDTPMRRSGRGRSKSRLATVSVARSDGASDDEAEAGSDSVAIDVDTGTDKREGEEDGDEEEDEEDEGSSTNGSSSESEEEASLAVASSEENASGSSAGSSAASDDDEEEEEEDEDDPDPDDPNDEDVEINEDEDDQSSEDEDEDEDAEAEPDVGADLASTATAPSATGSGSASASGSAAATPSAAAAAGADEDEDEDADGEAEDDD
ncbi:hypothetical protein LTR84_004947 [Exophiala bonariae]|uniref:Histone acetyltransferase n=1 Tax=Exophiala bonariae TaxID=1690606 RepID=A0AAV9NNV5_9EURO|nr:hypothetical protein LTR84_004947 [Exophiala bonariae]